MSARLSSGICIAIGSGLLVIAAAQNGCGSSASRTADASTGGSGGTGGGTATGGSGGHGGGTATGGSGGSTATGGSGGSGGASACGTCPLTGATSDDYLYVNVVPVGECTGTVPFGSMNNWFSYDDGTGDASSFVHAAAENGCVSGTCAYHAQGGGFTGYGAGVGITLADNAKFDASKYTGLELYLKGTTTGTRGPNFVKADNTVHVKFPNLASDGGDVERGNDYGAYCATQEAGGGDCWVKCQIPFSGVTQDGYDAGAGKNAFALTDLVKIQFEFSAYTPPADSGTKAEPVSFDVWIDNVSFYK